MSEQREGKSIGVLTIKADVSEALKGIKAVNRELKETVKLLKEIRESKPQPANITINCTGPVNAEEIYGEIQKRLSLAGVG
jgi:hypothetical protein